MDDSVEDQEKWLYSSAEDTAGGDPQNMTDSQPPPQQTTDDLSQIFADNQSTDDFRQLFDESNASVEQSLDQSVNDHMKEEKDYELSAEDKALTTDMNDNNDDDEDDDEDDDDDDVQVTIGDIKANTSFPYGSTPMNINITKRGNFAAGQSGSSVNKPKAGLDIEAVGNINGVDIYDVNLDNLEEKPWRKPGADITDYFNYGFNEDMWKMYCERQKKLRNHDFLTNGPPQNDRSRPTPSTSNAAPAGAASVPGKPGSEQTIPIASINENSKYTGAGLTKKAGPPPGRKQSGTIDVIGGGTLTTPSMLPSRRQPDNPKENFIQVIGNRPPGPPGPPPPGMPPGMPFPPPGMSGMPPGMPPPFRFPPPGVDFPPGLPPPGMPLIGPNGQPIPFPPPGGDFPHMPFPPPGMMGHPNFDEPVDGYHEGMGGDGNEDRNRDRDRDRDRDYHRSSRGYSREFRDDDSFRSSRQYRERQGSDRDYEHNERPRDREEESRRHRDRDKDREREKSDSHRDRERESSSRRRHKEEYEDEHNTRSSSRHKHSKRSKRDKEEEKEESKH